MNTSTPGPKQPNASAQAGGVEIVFVDEPADTTVRPTRPEIPLGWWPRPRRPSRPDPAESNGPGK